MRPSHEPYDCPIIDEAITEAEMMLDATKYYRQEYGRAQLGEIFASWVKLLETLKLYHYTDEDLLAAYDHQFDLGFGHAKALVRAEILENSKIKTRGEMLAALQTLEMGKKKQ